VPLHIPPLRERRDDIRLLGDHIIRKFNERLKKRVTGLEPAALERLTAYGWPGNIRELENVLERTLLFCDSIRIRPGDLPPGIGAAATPAAPPLPNQSTQPLAAVSERAPTGPQSLKDIVRAETERVERELIVRALDETGGNVTQAARLLKISRKSLQMKMKEFGLRERPE
jgi:DNA-binding NtrC family response regulator